MRVRAHVCACVCACVLCQVIADLGGGILNEDVASTTSDDLQERINYLATANYYKQA